jgi:hypothetical protein
MKKILKLELTNGPGDISLHFDVSVMPIAKVITTTRFVGLLYIPNHPLW